MKNNKVYLPVDAIDSRKDFDVYYADGDTFLHFSAPWERERDKVAFFGRMGGYMGHIKPDHKALQYYLVIERWEYQLHTYELFNYYGVVGMHWEGLGSPSKPPFTFENDKTGKKDVAVKLSQLKGHGPCYEIAVSDVAKLRIATVAIVGILLKEHYRGLSEGVALPSVSKWDTFKKWWSADKGKTYEEVLEDARIRESMGLSIRDIKAQRDRKRAETARKNR